MIEISKLQMIFQIYVSVSSIFSKSTYLRLTISKACNISHATIFRWVYI